MLQIEDNYNHQPLWDWMNERHRIYLRRQQGLSRPWTDDPTMQEFSFCNVFRELDRVTIWIREYIREPYANHPNLWFMLALARTINWPPTLQAIMDRGLWPTDRDWFAQLVADLLREMSEFGEKVYTGAYMIRAESDPNNEWYNRTKHEYICHNVLGGLWNKTIQGQWNLGQYLFHGVGQQTLQYVHKAFLSYHGWGPFMAYEVVTDMRWTRYLSGAPDIYTWANAGPGALRGLNRIDNRPLTAPRSAKRANDDMSDLLDIANGHGNIAFSPLDTELFHWSGEFKPLEMRDIEHSLCEMDKWLRVRNGEGRPRAKYHGKP